MNLQKQRDQKALRDSERLVASPDGTHFFTFRPDWSGPIPLPFRAAAATIDLLQAFNAPRVLILGFGMGAMGSMMKTRMPSAKIVGIEPDRKLHKAATAALTPDVTLRRSDAMSFLRRTNETFDLILDDCFVVTADVSGEQVPYRPPKLEVLPELSKTHLSPNGIYARNLLDQDDLSLDQQRQRILKHFNTVCDRSFRDWDNVLVVASDFPLCRTTIAALGS